MRKKTTFPSSYKVRPPTAYTEMRGTCSVTFPTRYMGDDMASRLSAIHLCYVTCAGHIFLLALLCFIVIPWTFSAAALRRWARSSAKRSSSALSPDKGKACSMKVKRKGRHLSEHRCTYCNPQIPVSRLFSAWLAFYPVLYTPDVERGPAITDI